MSIRSERDIAPIWDTAVDYGISVISLHWKKLYKFEIMRRLLLMVSSATPHEVRRSVFANFLVANRAGLFEHNVGRRVGLQNRRGVIADKPQGVNALYAIGSKTRA